MSYVPVPDATKVTILRALADGRRIDRVAVELQLSAEVVRRVSAAHGYPDRHKMSWAADVIAKGADVRGGTPAGQPAGASSPTSPPPARQADDVARLLARAGKSTKARTRALAKRIGADLDRLREAVDHETEDKKAAAAEAARKAKEKAQRDAEQRKIRARPVELEREAAKLRAGLQRSTAVPPGAVALGLDPKAVRRWAVANDVACTVTGRVPKAVVQAYLDAHGGAS